MPLTPQQFIAKWAPAALSERAASQEHFIDLCGLLGQPTPAGHDATGAEYTFEKGVSVTAAASAGSDGQRGFADVWWRGKFGWEYKRKGKHKDLADAYRQLCVYREALENPPLLVVCDIARVEIHTNFTGTRKETHSLALADFDQPETLDKLRRVFTDPASFKPQQTSAKITETTAAAFGRVAQRLRERGHDPHDAAHFLMKLMFCLFAEDVDLLPKRLFSTLLDGAKRNPASLTGRLDELFARMRSGGYFGNDEILFFNGGLFDAAPALPLEHDEIVILLMAGAEDWGAVEPAIFGTLFERSLDPAKRAQIGAHYTSREDIMLIVEPVVIAPLRREWDETRAECEKLIEKLKGSGKRVTGRGGRALKESPARVRLEKTIEAFVDRLASVRILDPACGSGNFLYVAIQELLKLEKEVITFAARPDIALGLIPRVRPTQLYGIEINAYAAELAQVVIWIGYLQWMRDNGFVAPRNPVLEPLQTIEQRDAILDFTIPDKPQPATWPEADFIIGNPPFLGSKLFRKWGMEEDYIAAMYGVYDIPNTADLCAYWFEQARRAINRSEGVRAGLLATQGIRGTFSREVLDRIATQQRIFMAWSDRKWILDGAAVHVSLVGFAARDEVPAMLDGRAVDRIHANLTSGVDLTRASKLSENSRTSFMGDTKGGNFDIEVVRARQILATPNPFGKETAEVVRPWQNGLDITRRWRGMYIIDFGVDREQEEASLYEAPFEYVRQHVLPERRTNRREAYRKRWWIHVEPRPDLRAACRDRGVIATPNLTKYRFFVKLRPRTLPDHQLIVFARDDDYFFGVLHSSVHELWARRMGTQLREAESGFRYTPTTCFETFPLPWSPGQENTRHIAYLRIAEAAEKLNAQRERWLNPEEWIDEIAERIDREDDFADVARVSGEEARRLIRHSAIMAAAAKDPRLKKRTLTNLYNERPTWLRLAHAELDRAVLAAYAAQDPEGDWAEEWADVWEETGAGQTPADDHPLAERRREVDERVLAHLLRLNLARAGG